MVLGKLVNHLQKNETRTLSNTIHTHTHTHTNSKWIKDLNLRPENIKLLEENIGKTLSDIHHSNLFFDPTPREMEAKAKINKWHLIKLKSFLHSKGNTNKMKNTTYGPGKNIC